MTNEIKLLRAFIEASGFDVEEVFDTKPDQRMIDAGWAATPDSYKVTKKEPEPMCPSFVTKKESETKETKITNMEGVIICDTDRDVLIYIKGVIALNGLDYAVCEKGVILNKEQNYSVGDTVKIDRVSVFEGDKFISDFTRIRITEL